MNASGWEAQISLQPNSDELRKLIMWTDAKGVKQFPTNLTDWRGNKGWQTLIWIYTASEFSTENIDFLEDADAFRSGQARPGHPSVPTAQELYDLYISDGADKRINLPATMFKALGDALQAGDVGAIRPALDDADREITGLVSSDTYSRFRVEITRVQSEWAAAADAGKAKVSALVEGSVKSTPQRPPDTEEVRKWNLAAVQALSRNTPTDFFQLGELVLVANPAAGTPPPGIGWLQTQKGLVSGKITKKSAVFGDPSILAEGVREQDRVSFEDAIRFAFDKGKIDFVGKADAPVAKKTGAFGQRSR